MNLICISNQQVGFVSISNQQYALTIGKSYEYNSISSVGGISLIGVINDNGSFFEYPSELFITLAEFRNKKLELIGI